MQRSLESALGSPLVSLKQKVPSPVLRGIIIT